MWSWLLAILKTLKTLRPMHYFALGALTIILIEITLLVSPLKTTNAASLGDQFYPCGPSLHVVLHLDSETSCDSNGYNASMTHYQSAMTVKAIHTVNDPLLLLIYS